jgi:Immunoglobulin I-set domain.
MICNENIWIIVTGENETAVSLKSTWNSERKVQGGTNPMKIVVDYNAPENIKVKWFGPENKEIVNSNKYTVTTKSSQTILDVANVTVYDAGNYTVEISDKTSVPKHLTLSAIIQGKTIILYRYKTKLWFQGISHCVIIQGKKMGL